MRKKTHHPNVMIKYILRIKLDEGVEAEPEPEDAGEGFMEMDTGAGGDGSGVAGSSSSLAPLPEAAIDNEVSDGEVVTG